MPRKPCFWTRKLELQLVQFVKEREFIWKTCGNTNHHIQQKYKAYAEFATDIGRGFTARSVRDRWVNIRSTFNHNLRRVDRSKETAKSPTDIYVPCWPLWKPLQFLRTDREHKKDNVLNENYTPASSQPIIKEEVEDNINDIINIRQRAQASEQTHKYTKKSDRESCCAIVDNLVKSMEPILRSCENAEYQNYWFFGKHVAERLSCMRQEDASAASHEIMYLLQNNVLKYELYGNQNS